MGITVDPTQQPYNAPADGINDDRAALQRAIDDVEAAGGGIVLLPGERTFVIASHDNAEDDTQRTSLLIDRPNVTLASDTHATIVIRAGADVRAIIVRNTSHVTIRDIEFRNELSTSTLCIQASSDVRVLHCRFTGGSIGLTISEDTSLRGTVTAGDDLVTDVRNFDRWNQYDAIAGEGISNDDSVQVIQKISPNTLRLSRIATASDGDAILFNRTTGACNDIEIAYNQFRNCGLNGIQQFPKAKSRNIAILFNTLEGCGLADSDGSSIKCGQATENTLVTGNRIVGGRHGIAAVNYESVLVEGNHLLNVGDWALSVGVREHPNYSAGYALSVFRNNVAVWTGTPPTSAQGINVNGGATLLGGTVNVGPIEFEGNTFYSPYQGFVVRLLKPLKNIRLTRNSWIDPRDLSECGAAAGGAAPQDIAFTGNETIVRIATSNVQWRIEGVTGALIDGNTFTGCGGSTARRGVLKLAGSDIAVSHNRFLGNNVPGFNPSSAIQISSYAEARTYRVVGNLIDNRSLTPGLQYLVDNDPVTASGAVIVERDNVSLQENVVPIRYYPSGASTSSGWTSASGLRVLHGTAAPASGTFPRGDRVVHTSPAAGGWERFVCTVGGSPGTWEEAAPIDPLP